MTSEVLLTVRRRPTYDRNTITNPDSAATIRQRLADLPLQRGYLEPTSHCARIAAQALDILTQTCPPQHRKTCRNESLTDETFANAVWVNTKRKQATKAGKALRRELLQTCFNAIHQHGNDQYRCDANGPSTNACNWIRRPAVTRLHHIRALAQATVERTKPILAHQIRADYAQAATDQATLSPPLPTMRSTDRPTNT